MRSLPCDCQDGVRGTGVAPSAPPPPWCSPGAGGQTAAAPPTRGRRLRRRPRRRLFAGSWAGSALKITEISYPFKKKRFKLSRECYWDRINILGASPVPVVFCAVHCSKRTDHSIFFVRINNMSLKFESSPRPIPLVFQLHSLFQHVFFLSGFFFWISKSNLNL